MSGTSRWYNSVLGPVSDWYKGIVNARRHAYHEGKQPRLYLPRPVISVGNLSVGGTGKTPVVIFLAQQLAPNGHVAVLSRGYRRRSPRDYLTLPRARRLDSDACKIFGDEPVMLAYQNLENISVHVGIDRYRCGMMALQRTPADVFLLDDGFQHMGLHRDLDIVLIDGTRDPHTLELFPAGPLREPVENLAQADVIWITRCMEDGSHCVDLDRIAAIAPNSLVVTSRYEARKVCNLVDNTSCSVSQIANRNVFAFCAIGTPDSFFDTLREYGATLVGTKAFPDHHVYSRREMERLFRKARLAGATALITTEKDAVRVENSSGWPMPVLELRVRVKVLSGAEKLMEIIHETCGF